MPQAAVRAATVNSTSERRSGRLTLDDLGGGRRRYRLPGVVLVEVQWQLVGALRARLGDLIVERVAVAFADPAVELIAVLVLGFRVPRFPAGQTFLADIGEVGGTGEAPRSEARAGRGRRPLAIPGAGEGVIGPVDRDILEADLLTGHRGLELEAARAGRFVDDGPLTVDVDHGALVIAFALDQEVGVLQVGMVRLGQDVFRRWRSAGSATGGDQARGH